MQSSLFFSLRIWEGQMSSLVTFPVFFNKYRLWIEICRGHVQILEYFCGDFIPLIFLKHLDRSLISVLVWVHLSMTYQLIDFWNQFSTWLRICWPHILKTFVSVVLLLFLNSRNITYWICTFNQFILGSWDHRSNYDVYSFTIEIKNDQWMHSLIRWFLFWGERIHWLLSCRVVRPLNECPDMTLNNLMRLK